MLSSYYYGCESLPSRKLSLDTYQMIYVSIERHMTITHFTVPIRKCQFESVTLSSFFFSHSIQSRFYLVLQDLMSCPVYTIRKLAAFSLALFMPVTSLIPMLKSWTTAHSRQADHNFNHGFLLMAKHLLEIKLDDATFAKAISIDIFLQISTAVLRIDNQPLLHCTLLEIYQTLIQSLYKSNSKENLIHRGSYFLCDSSPLLFLFLFLFLFLLFTLF